MFIQSLVLLSAFGYSVLAGKAGPLKGGSGVSRRQVEECLNEQWIPVCPGDLPCIPPEGTCCTGDYYHLPGETCPVGYSEVPRIDQSNPPPASITPAPSPSPIPDSVALEYTWYTFTYTYYYYYYYYYYFESTYEITSTETTYYTTFSLSATDEAAASSAFESVTADIVLAIPTQSETPTISSVPAPSSTLGPSSTPVVAPSSSRVTTSSRATTSSVATTSTVGNASVSVSLPPEFTGAAANIRAGTIAASSGLFAFAIGACFLTPGMLMLLL